MTTLAQNFEASSASLTVDSGSWVSGAVITTTALNIASLSPVPDDLLLTVNFIVPSSGTLASNSCVNIYAALSEDGTHYTDNDQYSGTANLIATLRKPTNFYGPFKLWVPTLNINPLYGVIISVLSQFNMGVLPRLLGFVLENQTGVTLTSPAATWSPAGFTNN